MLKGAGVIARGGLLGAFVGDASGATLEFFGRTPSHEDVERALSMVGGGCWRVAPGQITDDGELALCLARSLAGAQAVDRDKVAEAYVGWFNSGPFDIGNATHNAFGHHRARERVTAHLVEEAARRSNMASKANGALMRSIGLGIWSWRLSPEEAANAARSDARLSHPNPSCQHANAACIQSPVRHLVLNAGDSRGALRAASAALNNEGARRKREAGLAKRRPGRGTPYHPNAGFVRTSHSPPRLAISKRRPRMSRRCARRWREGGDTDTNACINPAGLLGTLHGRDDIPQPMRAAVLNCDTALRRPRPKFFSTRDAAARPVS